jgi:hypothetical protein
LTGYNDDHYPNYRPNARTDAEGRYEIRGVHKSKSYRLQVVSDTAMGYTPTEMWTDDTAGYRPVVADLTVRKGVIVTGKVIDRTSGQPIRGWAAAAVLPDNPFAKDYTEILEPNQTPKPARSEGMDADDTFRLVTIPGPVLLMGGPDHRLMDPLEALKFAPPVPDAKYPQGNAYLGSGRQPGPIRGNFCKVLDIKPGVPVVLRDIVLERARVIEVKCQDPEGRGLAGIWAAGVNSSPDSPEGGGTRAVRVIRDTCPVYDLQPGKSRLLVFCEPDRKLAGTLIVHGEDTSPLRVKLGAAGALKGRLLDEAGKPLAGVEIEVRYQERGAAVLASAVSGNKPPVTDADGAFVVGNVIPGLKIKLAFRRGSRRLTDVTEPTRTDFMLEPGQFMELGVSTLRFLPPSPVTGKDRS